jgi:hypothetical protein
VLGLKIFNQGRINRYRVTMAVAGPPVQFFTPMPDAEPT